MSHFKSTKNTAAIHNSCVNLIAIAVYFGMICFSVIMFDEICKMSLKNTY